MSADKRLIKAAKCGHHNVVRRLLDEGCDATAEDVILGWTPLMHAARHGRLKVVKLLVESIPGFQNDFNNPNNVDALQLAVFYGHIDVIKVLVAAGISPEERRPWGPDTLVPYYLGSRYPPGHVWHDKYSSIDIATLRGNAEALQVLRQAPGGDENEAQPAEMPAVTGQSGAVGDRQDRHDVEDEEEEDEEEEEEEEEDELEMYLYLAVWQRNYKMAAEILEWIEEARDAKVDAMWAAVWEGDLETLEELLDRVDPDEFGLSDEYLDVCPVYDKMKRAGGNDVNRLLRVLRGVEQMVDAWSDDLAMAWEIRRNFLLIEAIYKRDLPVLEALLAIGADANSRLDHPTEVQPDGEYDEEEWLDVYDAQYSTWREFLEPLDDDVGFGGCDIKITPTPITLAIKRDFIEALRPLVESGAYVDGHGDFYGGWSPLHTATNLDKIAAVRELLALGADAKSRTAEHWKDGGSTPLHCARSVEIVEELLAAGADVSARDAKGRTPLHRLPEILDTWGGDACGIAAALLASGAEINAIDADGSTPLHAACPFMFPRLDLVELLLDFGADASLRDNSGRTALEVLLADSTRSIRDFGLPGMKERRSDPRYQWNCLGDHQLGVAGALLCATPGAWEALPDIDGGAWWAAGLGSVWRRDPQNYRRMCRYIRGPTHLKYVYEHLDRRMTVVLRMTARAIMRKLPPEKCPPEVRRRVLEAMFAASPYDYRVCADSFELLTD